MFLLGKILCSLLSASQLLQQRAQSLKLPIITTAKFIRLLNMGLDLQSKKIVSGNRKLDHGMEVTFWDKTVEASFKKILETAKVEKRIDARSFHRVS